MVQSGSLRKEEERNNSSVDASIMLSVIVPVYNTADYLEFCVNSILAQQYQNLDIILVDDGSTDGSDKLCDLLAKKDKRIRVVHQQNGGLMSARGTGVNNARADFVTFVDSDDWIEPDMYQIMLGAIEANSADVVTSGFIQDECGAKRFDSLKSGVYENEKLSELRGRMMFDASFNTSGVIMSVCNKIFRKSIIQPYLEKMNDGVVLWQDIIYTYAPMINARKIVILHEAFYHYRSTNNSMSRKRTDDIFERTELTLNVADKLYKSFSKSIYSAYTDLAFHIFYAFLCDAFDEKGRTKDDVKRAISKVSNSAIVLNGYSIVECNLRPKVKKRVFKAMVDKKEGKVYSYLAIASLRRKISKAAFSIAGPLITRIRAH